MITIALTYRNRDLRIVKNCLDSLKAQSLKEFKVILVDYGSAVQFSEGLAQLVQEYSFITLIQCPVAGQLWNKSRAINIALKQCDTPYFLVGDIDMLFRKDVVLKLQNLRSASEITYFQVGFLSQEEAAVTKLFEEYKIKHLSSEEATGITLYPTKLLLEINGYDEFFHGWGAEDTDVHIRLLHKEVKVHFYATEVMLLHQWHPKQYRSVKSKEPFHSYLEKINHQYVQKVSSTKKVMANTAFEWGKLPIQETSSNKNVVEITITNQKSEVDAFIYGYLNAIQFEKVMLKIIPHKEFNSFKNNLKKVLNKKAVVCYDFEELNNLLLLTLISSYRNHQYVYEWDQELNTIRLNLYL
ncbi:glycosyltransferase family 2 protein [Lutibacter sp.]|uniref:glycosyltransferase family 2 protein n=1 Tax=Lutibacter sp. TaxID=1925666 RepID=UPI001A29546F|nr:galactosyltransferase-related protein [Lutibacter sp.]MBI9042247.1 glycosyltransferase [Lutibacter sp.]